MINKLINQLLQYSLEHDLLQPSDEEYAVNRLLYLLKLDTVAKEEVNRPVDFFEVIEQVLAYAVKRNLIEFDVEPLRDNFEAKVIDCFLPRPSELNKNFRERYKKGPRVATEYFFELSKASNYIKTKRIEKNITYQYQGKYGHLDITINLSKPEKDPKLIALSVDKSNETYPKCALCMENVGYYGSLDKAPRSNHRVIDLTLNHEKNEWGFQYSPYAYFNEHSIVLKKSHIPMNVDKNTFYELIDFINQFPHYLMGSNAGLPIVGGSILSHYHFQGGRYDFPIEKARVLKTFKKRGIEVEVLDWPLSVIRVVGNNENQVLDMVELIFESWKLYDNPDLEILSNTGEPHNTITPIVKLSGSKFNFYIVLRNNRATKERPYGIFHPQEKWFHIKKENIGLIEVMGLAVLPGRLKNELDQIKQCLLKGDNPEEIKEIKHHLPWIKTLKQVQPEQIEKYLKDEVGKIFEHVIEDCGVFKSDDKETFYRFVERSIY
jgi:UDPglucose--hexose-1-phosphate uridylyltransferase